MFRSLLGFFVAGLVAAQTGAVTGGARPGTGEGVHRRPRRCRDRSGGRGRRSRPALRRRGDPRLHPRPQGLRRDFFRGGGHQRRVRSPGPPGRGRPVRVRQHDPDRRPLGSRPDRPAPPSARRGVHLPGDRRRRHGLRDRHGNPYHPPRVRRRGRAEPGPGRIRRRDRRPPGPGLPRPWHPCGRDHRRPSTYGVAKKVALVAVRVLDCNGSGTTSGVIAGVDWVTADHAAGAPAVANMSLGGAASTTLDDAVKRSVADGVALCRGRRQRQHRGRGPGRLWLLAGPGARGHDRGGQRPRRPPERLSNYGACIDWFAPGVEIDSAWADDDDATQSLSGTSMASPHTAGVAALYLESKPLATP